MLVLQIEGGYKQFFNRKPGDHVTVAYGLPEARGDGDPKGRLWTIPDARKEVMQIQNVSYDYYSNAGKVVRLTGTMNGLVVRLSAYTEYRTAIVTID